MKKLKVTFALIAFFLLAGVLSGEKNIFLPQANAVQFTVPGMDEFTHGCMAWVQVSATVGEIGPNGIVTGSFTMTRVAGNEVSCEMAWATCSRYTDCVAGGNS